MLAPPTGNMLDVYRRTARLRHIRKIKKQALKTLDAVLQKAKPLEAEIAPEPADWYLVHTFPGDDVRAMRWLARRRFGVFRVMQQRRDRRNDIKLQGMEPAFPGWLFVFVWDIKKMKDRLRACPGVMSIFCDPVSQEPVPINQPDEDGVLFIEKLRALSWAYNENAPHAQRHSARASMSTARSNKKPRVQRPTKKQRKQLERLKKDFKARGLEWDQSTWEYANSLAPHERIALLHRTLLNAPPL